jgi:uncharacterized protein YgbK (DUF1537 family)
MDPTPLSLASTLASLPPEWPEDPAPAIQAARRAAGQKVVVVDDDPTGTQAVHGVSVLTAWPVEALAEELENDLPALFLLTNSRSLPLAEAQAINYAIGQNLKAAAQRAGRSFVVISRGDSTLRGHFPGEVQALADGLDERTAPWLLIPYLREGGRYTLGDVHYLADGDRLLPVGQSEFARDATFGYQASNLREWVAEKSGGRIAADSVASVSLDDLRRGGPTRATERLLALAPAQVCVVNALGFRDLEVFTQGLLAAEAMGRRFLYRTAPSFVAARAGTGPRLGLTAADLGLPAAGGGLIVVGSYVPKTSGQLQALLERGQVRPVELAVEALLSPEGRAAEIKRVAAEADGGLRAGEDVVVYTSRRLVTGADAEQSLSIGRVVSDGVVAVLHAIETRPRYVLAKGGITSSDAATRGLGIRRAMVLGQVLPGVAVWQAGPESRYPGLSYLVFPGNVGGPEALADAVAALRP